MSTATTKPDNAAEQDELKELQEKRKAAGDPKVVGQISDSERTRLSELLKKEEEGKGEGGSKAEPKAANPTAKKSPT